MKTLSFTAVLATILMTGCASKVTTYDAQGQLIGSCVSSSGFVLGAQASCIGHANQEGKK